MNAEQIVIRPATALALHNAGIRFPAVFSYYATAGDLDLRLTGESDLPFVAPPTPRRNCLNYCPGGLEIDTQTLIAAENGWANLRAEEIRYRYAHLSVIKTPGDSYLCAYYYENRQIAFSKTTDGKAENLFVNEDNQAESLAQMVLKLLREGKLPDYAHPVPEAQNIADELRITLETVLAPVAGNTLPETEILLERLTDHVYRFFIPDQAHVISVRGKSGDHAAPGFRAN